VKYCIDFYDASWLKDLLAVDRLLLPPAMIEASDVDDAFRQARAIAITNGIEPDRCEIVVEDVVAKSYYLAPD